MHEIREVELYGCTVALVLENELKLFVVLVSQEYSNFVNIRTKIRKT
jgi:hypothetical protein